MDLARHDATVMAEVVSGIDKTLVGLAVNLIGPDTAALAVLHWALAALTDRHLGLL